MAVGRLILNQYVGERLQIIKTILRRKSEQQFQLPAYKVHKMPYYKTQKKDDYLSVDVHNSLWDSAISNRK